MDCNLPASNKGSPMKKSIHSQEHIQFLEMLKAARESAGLTQADLAANLGATQTFVSKCERGERRLDVIELRHWCSALGISFPGFVKRFDQKLQQ